MGKVPIKIFGGKKKIPDTIAKELIKQKDSPMSLGYGASTTSTIMTGTPKQSYSQEMDERAAMERQHMERARANAQPTAEEEAAQIRANRPMNKVEFREQYPTGSGKYPSPPPIEYSEELPVGMIKNGKVVLANPRGGEGVSLSQENASIWEQAWAAEKSGTLGKAAPENIKKKLKKKRK